MGYDLQEQSRQGNNLDNDYPLSDYEHIMQGNSFCKSINNNIYMYR